MLCALPALAANGLFRHLGKLPELAGYYMKFHVWAGTLSQEWMEQNSELAGILYVDGHVRRYHGRLTKLPKRYVTRQRLCLRGTTDYWVNDALGQPFCSIERPIDQGML